jgi:hypothetical protein
MKKRIYMIVQEGDQRDLAQAEPSFEGIVSISFNKSKMMNLLEKLRANDANMCRQTGSDPTYYTIISKSVEMPDTQVAIEVEGGLVQSVYAKGGPVDVEIFDLDVSDVLDDDEELEEVAEKEKRWNEIEADPMWKEVY